MANSAASIVAGVVTVEADGFTVSSNADFRQAVVVADPSTEGGAAPVDATKGLATFQADPILTFHRIASGGAGDSVNVKASAGYLRGWTLFNVADAPVYVKFHNSATTPTAGSGVVFTIGLQAGVRSDMILPGRGRLFSSGLGMTIVTGIVDSAAGLVTADTVSVELFYE